MRFLPRSASSMFLISQFTAAVDMLFLFKFGFFASAVLLGARKAGEKLTFDEQKMDGCRIHFRRIHEVREPVRVPISHGPVRLWDYSHHCTFGRKNLEPPRARRFTKENFQSLHALCCFFDLASYGYGFPKTGIAGQLGRFVGRLPGEVGVAAAEVAVGSGLLIDRTAQVERLDDSARRQLEMG